MDLARFYPVSLYLDAILDRASDWNVGKSLLGQISQPSGQFCLRILGFLLPVQVIVKIAFFKVLILKKMNKLFSKNFTSVTSYHNCLFNYELCVILKSIRSICGPYNLKVKIQRNKVKQCIQDYPRVAYVDLENGMFFNR